MVPQTPQSLYEILASRHPDVGPDQIKELITEYYRHSRNVLSSLEEPVVAVLGLGIFSIKPNILEKEEPKYANWEQSKIAAVRENYKSMHFRIQKLQEWQREQDRKKKEKRIERYAYIDAKQKLRDEQADTSVEAQKGDS